ncbi:Uncharacterized conserved protein [Meinhardsimonia xiamenensis]|uniref:Uncharacterized conserved protein n=1 Tax=Meinhardsimonia xiamenensis TaxID=990712 RepID=A0A1G8Z9C0_9RHOB|nr:RimK/LysX family protein [Meinhardsimonia xiamenensis]PRX37607.1 hypothetical protein LV81_01387 [Meinhardsimonia xiamenensis]SDK11648.1 Uncharacterized conserved protein [Meinhardsimonia xiamenensis]
MTPDPNAAAPAGASGWGVVGWRERVALPELGLDLLPAKIDTGARTSALHATHIVEFERDGRRWVRFHIPHASGVHARDCVAPLADRRRVKNTGGVPQERHVIETLLVLGRRRWRIEVTLADRAEMRHPLILGRTAIRRHRLLVDPGRSWLWGAPVVSRHRSSLKAAPDRQETTITERTPS